MTNSKKPYPYTAFESIIDFELYGVDWSPDGRYVAVAGSERLVHIWDVKNGEVFTLPFEPHPNTIISLYWSPDGKHIATLDIDEHLRIWNVESFISI